MKRSLPLVLKNDLFLIHNVSSQNSHYLKVNLSTKFPSKLVIDQNVIVYGKNFSCEVINILLKHFYLSRAFIIVSDLFEVHLNKTNTIISEYYNCPIVMLADINVK